MPIVLYGNETSPPCRFVWIVGKALGIEVVIKKVDAFKHEQRTEAFEKMNPAQTIPTLDDNGFQLWESRAIVGYLLHKYGKDNELYPNDANMWSQVDNILYFDFALYNATLEYYTDDVVQGKPVAPERAEALKKKLSILAKIVEKRTYAAGDQLTVADIALLTTLSGPAICGYSYAAYPAITRYIAKVKKDLPIYCIAASEGEAAFAEQIKSGQF